MGGEGNFLIGSTALHQIVGQFGSTCLVLSVIAWLLYTVLDLLIVFGVRTLQSHGLQCGLGIIS